MVKPLTIRREKKLGAYQLDMREEKIYALRLINVGTTVVNLDCGITLTNGESYTLSCNHPGQRLLGNVNVSGDNVQTCLELISEVD